MVASPCHRGNIRGMGYTVYYLVIIFAAFAGFLIAFYISHKKRSKETLVCPLNSNCNTVIHSEYSRFFGIPVENLGLLYYGFIALTYGVFLVAPDLALLSLVVSILAFTTGAFLFSLYLTAVQLFALHEICTWCLCSAALCTIIFISAAAESGLVFVFLNGGG